LGTNESYRNWNASYFNKEVNLCLDRITEASPTTEVILVLPNENYKKINGKYVYNAAVDSVRNSLKNIAAQRQLTTYDQLEAMGGKGSLLEWLKQGLVNADHVHLLRKGYQKQGELLAAFLLGYLQNKPD
jgi:lysophospholipase L1-like esterase